MTVFWEKTLREDARDRLVNNIAGHLKDAKEFLQKRAVSIQIIFTFKNTGSSQKSVTHKSRSEMMKCGLSAFGIIYF